MQKGARQSEVRYWLFNSFAVQIHNEPQHAAGDQSTIDACWHGMACPAGLTFEYGWRAESGVQPFGGSA